MIKAVMIGVWAIILMAGSIYYFAIMAGAETKSSEKEDTRGLETFELQTSSYPVVRDGEIRGYIIMSALFTVVSKNAAKLPYPLDFQINDALLETFFADREIDVFQLEKVDLAQLKERILLRVNQDKEIVTEIKFKGFDYLSKNEIRDMKMRRY